MITWKFALMMLFGISNSLPMQSAKETKPKAETKANDAKVVEVKGTEVKPAAQVVLKKAEAPKAELKAVEGKKIEVKNVVEGKKIEAKVVEGKKIEAKNVLVAKADEPRVILQEVAGVKVETKEVEGLKPGNVKVTLKKVDDIKVEGIKIEIPKVELRQVAPPKVVVAAPVIKVEGIKVEPKVAVAAPVIKVEGIKVEPKVENVKVLLNKVALPKDAALPETVKVMVSKVDPANPKAVKTEAVDVRLTKVDPAKAITLQKLEGAAVTGTGTVTVTQAGQPHTFTVTQVAAPKGEEEKKTAIIKAVGDDKKVHIVQVQVLPNGEVKVISDGVQGTATPAQAKELILKKVEAAKAGEEAKALILKKLEAAKVGEETAKAVRSVVVAQAQAKADEAKAKAEKAKAEIKSDAKSKTIELRIEIKGDGTPKVEVITPKDKPFEVKPDVRKIEGVRKLDEVRKVEGRIVEAAKAAPGAKPNTASIVINGEAKTFTLPDATAKGVMKLVISEDGKGFKIESDGKAKTEVLELQKVLKAADIAQVEALNLRKKAEELRAQAMKEAETAKQLQLKFNGDIKDLNKKLEGRIVESRARVVSEGDKIDQLNKRMDKIEKMIEDLAKKVK